MTRRAKPAPTTPLRLGPLERAVLERLWERGELDVREAHAALGEPASRSPKTTQSALERLVRKQLVARRRRGRAYAYRALSTRAEWIARVVDDLFASVSTHSPGPMLAAFVDLAERAGEPALAQLDELVRQRRRARERDA